MSDEDTREDNHGLSKVNTPPGPAEKQAALVVRLERLALSSVLNENLAR
jgi:hypothetical protein